MTHSPDEILARARKLDTALEQHRIEEVVERFAPDCTIEVLGITLRGLEGVRRWGAWIFGHLAAIQFTHVTVMAEGDTYFEEFVLNGVFHDGRSVDSRQAVVLTFAAGKITSLRLYFDPLDFAEAEGGMLGRFTVHEMRREILKGLD
jgi:ketosteroid isomerase-like protein